jgi:hypothetical protein
VANLCPINIIALWTLSHIHASYSILSYNYADMNDNIDRTKQDSKEETSQRGGNDNNNKNQRATVSRDIKDRMNEAIEKPNIEGDPTRSDE